MSCNVFLDRFKVVGVEKEEDEEKGGGGGEGRSRKVLMLNQIKIST